MIVVFPEPFGPLTRKCSPFLISQFKFTRTLWSSQPTFTSSNFMRLSGTSENSSVSKAALLSLRIFFSSQRNSSLSFSRTDFFSAFLASRRFSYSERLAQKEIFLSENSSTRFIFSGISVNRSMHKIMRGKSVPEFSVCRFKIMLKNSIRIERDSASSPAKGSLKTSSLAPDKSERHKSVRLISPVDIKRSPRSRIFSTPQSFTCGNVSSLYASFARGSDLFFAPPITS